MTFPRQMTRQEVVREIYSQRQWIEQCGGTLAGYVRKYGSASDTEFYGNGGEAIYRADMDTLRELESRV